MVQESEYEWVEFDNEPIKSPCGKSISMVLTVKNIENEKRNFKLKIRPEFRQNDPKVSWEIDYQGNEGDMVQMSPDDPKNIEKRLEIDKRAIREFKIRVDTPKGGSMGDSMTLNISVVSEDDVHRATFSKLIDLVPIIMAVKTNVGKEFEVAQNLVNQDKKDYEERVEINPSATREIMAIMSPYELKGYFYLETMHPDRITYIAKKMRNFKGVVNGEIRIDEISEQLTPKPAVEGLELGSFIELVKGPFKGEKARIMNIDHEKEEVTVQFIESAMLIPVKVRAEDIRVIDSGKS
ncbi:MAG: transcription elongation factor Spt5 [Candidatus Thermoplasmatota archaeon]|jgi:transcriptional antiterminator NusG|nr:transcription elongation factor Spt5 [Candidatus Thermoplasmatota archaeon]MCL5790453.1 transcription elongation factor Spt5 [Candidatus Thermoplasmatota archaeon]